MDCPQKVGKEGTDLDKKETGQITIYNHAKIWQIGFFSLNNAATNLYLALMGYMTYYANSVAGFSVMLISVLLTGLNVFDGITDPLVGFFLDKTKGKFGKFRPFMLLGNMVMAVSSILLFLTLHRIPKLMRTPYFILVYALYVLGYTFQTVVGKSGQTVITNDPKQRPLATYFDSLCIMASYGGTALAVSAYLVPKYGGFQSEALYLEFVFWIVVLSGICTLLAMVGIWEKDTPKVYQGKQQPKIHVRDYWDILCHNKPIRVLTAAACMNRFASTVYGHTTVGVMVFGILIQDYSIAGWLGVVTAIPTLFVVSAGIKTAQKLGQKKAIVVYTGLGIFFQILMLFLLMQKNVNTITFNIGHLNGISILFFLIYVFLNGCKSITNNMVTPMIADCSDYEESRSGRFVPGLMGAMFSFVDKVFTALGTAFVGIVVAAIGYNARLPQVGDPATPSLRATALFLFCGTPIIGWLVSLIAMNFYSLDKQKMREVAKKLSRQRIQQKEREDKEI
ncbi:MAG: MFS transporter [Lachnospiraceae bacterium]